MSAFDYDKHDKQMAAAKKAADKLKPYFESRILGKMIPAWSCECGEISQGISEAVEIVPPGGKKGYDGQIGLWYMWVVHMRNIGKNEGYDYSTGMNEFMPSDGIKAMFDEAFKGIDLKTLELESYRREELERLN
jgi:hypothetical protein